nr:MAG TPA: hypothetical protein [Caudoviricetes sp.]
MPRMDSANIAEQRFHFRSDPLLRLRGHESQQ